MSKLSKAALLCACAVLVVSMPAWAQTNPVDATSGAATPPEDSLDIIVTAQRRSERLSEVPLSITAFDNASLARTGAMDARALTQIAPGVNFQAFGSSAQPIIRGVGSNGAGIGDSSNVALYIDGVYQPLQGANFPRFEDVERVEILKGPQGTLYGRNAAGGAITITTLDPKFETTGRLAASYSRFNEVEVQGFATTPLTNTVAVSLSGDYTENKGIRRDIYLNTRVGYLNSVSARGKILWQPTPDTKVLLTAYYRLNNDLTNFGNQPYQGNSQLKRVNPALLVTTEPNTSSLSFVPKNRVKAWGGSLRIEQDVGGATLSSLTAITRANEYVETDSDLSPAAFSHARITINDNTVQQDLTLTSDSGGRFTWLVGGTYYAERANYDTRAVGNLTTVAPDPFNGLALTAGTIIPSVKNNAFAIFAEGAYKLTDQLTFTVGARYNNENPSFYAYRLPTAAAPNPAPPVSPSARFTSVTPHASLRYNIGNGTNIYASYSRGFKSGVFLPNSLQTQPVNPETIDAYEIGIKGAPSSSLTFDMAAFYYDYRDLQFQSYGAVASISTLRNAAKAEIYGFEENITFKPIRELTLRGGLAYTHGEYKEFLGAQGYFPVPGGGNALASIANASGRRLIRTPRIQANGTISYEKELDGAGGTVGGAVTASYTSAMFHDVSANTRQSPFTVVNANINYMLPDGHWRLSGFVNNVFNEKYLIGVLISGVGTGVTYARPVTYGARVEFLF